MLYVASFGPACWLFSSELVSNDQLNCVYRPLMRLTFHGPEIVPQSFRLYVRFWHGEQALVMGYLLDGLRVQNDSAPLFRYHRVTSPARSRLDFVHAENSTAGESASERIRLMRALPDSL